MTEPAFRPARLIRRALLNMAAMTLVATIFAASALTTDRREAAARDRGQASLLAQADALPATP